MLIKFGPNAAYFSSGSVLGLSLDRPATSKMSTSASTRHGFFPTGGMQLIKKFDAPLM
jgi:hypothetical protein